MNVQFDISYKQPVSKQSVSVASSSPPLSAPAWKGKKRTCQINLIKRPSPLAILGTLLQHAVRSPLLDQVASAPERLLHLSVQHDLGGPGRGRKDAMNLVLAGLYPVPHSLSEVANLWNIFFLFSVFFFFILLQRQVGMNKQALVPTRKGFNSIG